MKLSKELAKQAKAKGICSPWHAELLTLESKEEMVAMYIKGIDFCLANDYPKNDFIRKHFKGVMEKQGVFLDDDISIDVMDKNTKCVCLGTTKAVVNIYEYGVCEVFAKHNSCLAVNAEGNAFVVIDIFDDAVVHICANDKAKVCVNRYGGIVKYEANGDAIVKIREKNKKTY